MTETNESPQVKGPEGIPENPIDASSIAGVGAFSHPYRVAAHKYKAKGWDNPIPVGLTEVGKDDTGERIMHWLPGKKSSPPGKYTGANGFTVDTGQMGKWAEHRFIGACNIGLRLDPDVIAFDIDGPAASALLEHYESDRGPLPATFYSSSRGPDSVKRHLFFRIPADLAVQGAEMALKFLHGTENPETGQREKPPLDILHRGYRYAVVAPSLHPDGGVYAWYTAAALPCPVPAKGELPRLPDAWVDLIRELVEGWKSGALRGLPARVGSSGNVIEGDESYTRRSAEKAVANAIERAMAVPADVKQGFNDQMFKEARYTFEFSPNFWDADEIQDMWESALSEKFGAPDSNDLTTLNSARSGVTKAFGIEEGRDLSAFELDLGEGSVPDYHTDQFGNKYIGAEQLAARRAARVQAMRDSFLTPEQVDTLPTYEPLIHGVLYLDTLVWLDGAPKSGKSFVAIDWACHIAAEAPSWRGHDVTPGLVWYIAAEGGKGVGKRRRAWEIESGVKAKGLLTRPMPVLAKGTGDAAYSEDWAALIEIAQEVRPLLIVLDTQARMTAGMNENDNTEMGLWVHAASELKDRSGACVLVVHHTTKNGEDMRGASALAGALEEEFRADKARKGAIKLTHKLSKDGKDGEAWTFATKEIVVSQDEKGRDITSLVLGENIEGQEREDSPKRQVELTAESGKTATIQEAILKILETQDPNQYGLTTAVVTREVLAAYAQIGQRKKEGSVRTALGRLEQTGIITHPPNKDGSVKVGAWVLVERPAAEPLFLVQDAASIEALGAPLGAPLDAA